MKEEDRNDVKVTIKNEGFDYTFNDYSEFTRIEDEQFHKLREAYLEAREKLKEYINKDE